MRSQALSKTPSCLSSTATVSNSCFHKKESKLSSSNQGNGQSNCTRRTFETRPSLLFPWLQIRSLAFSYPGQPIRTSTWARSTCRSSWEMPALPSSNDWSLSTSRSKPETAASVFKWRTDRSNSTKAAAGATKRTCWPSNFVRFSTRNRCSQPQPLLIKWSKIDLVTWASIKRNCHGLLERRPNGREILTTSWVCRHRNGLVRSRPLWSTKP